MEPPINLGQFTVLKVLVDNQVRATVKFGLRLTLELFNFDGVVALGRLRRLSSQACDVTVSLTVEGKAVAGRKAPLNLRLELPLPANGIPLIRADSE
jgi:hypothetical protein